jgi:hypothetical protein
MMDIETLASTNTAAIIAIGTVVFDEDRFYAEQEILIDPRLAIGDRSPETWQWWHEQTEETRTMMFSGRRAPWDACQDLQGFLKDLNVKEVWANPPTFDLVILRSLFAACDEKVPWHWREERCMKTCFNDMIRMGYIPLEVHNPDKHSAISDARVQAKRQQDVFRFQRRIELLNSGKVEPD